MRLVHLETGSFGEKMNRPNGLQISGSVYWNRYCYIFFNCRNLILTGAHHQTSWRHCSKRQTRLCLLFLNEPVSHFLSKFLGIQIFCLIFVLNIPYIPKHTNIMTVIFCHHFYLSVTTEFSWMSWSLGGNNEGNSSYHRHYCCKEKHMLKMVWLRKHWILCLSPRIEHDRFDMRFCLQLKVTMVTRVTIVVPPQQCWWTIEI